MKLNLPNRLTLIRVLLIPFFLVFMLIPIPIIVAEIVSAIIFIAASLTDLFDGKIARKYGLITDFGKFMDPLADKVMVFAAMIGIMVLNRTDRLFTVLMAAATFIVIFREMAVTSLRLVAQGKEGVVIAANMAGKVKTTLQITFVLCALLEPVVFCDFLGYFFPIIDKIFSYRPLTYISMAGMTFMTIYSGWTYFKAYFPLLNPDK